MLGMPLRAMLGAQSDVYFPFVGLLLHCDGADASTIFTDVKGHTITAYHATKLLLHCDGADGSTTFTEVMGHTITASGNVQIDTAQSKFGGASALFDGSGDYLSTPSSTDWDFGSGDFTIEGWVYVSASTTNANLISRRSGTDWAPFSLLIVSNKFNFRASTSGSSWAVDITGNNTINDSTWHHFAFVRSGSSFKMYVDGVAQTATGSTASALMSSSQAIYIGANSDSTAFFNGWMDEIRITKGVARYTANFTPPTEAFPDS